MTTKDILLVLALILCPVALLSAKEFKICPQWTVVVLDADGKPMSNCKVEQTWSHWVYLDLEDLHESKLTDAQGQVRFPPRSLGSHPVRRSAAQTLGNIPHAGQPAPNAAVHLTTDGYKWFEQYYFTGKGDEIIRNEEPAHAVTEKYTAGLTTTFHLVPVDIFDALTATYRRDNGLAKKLLIANAASAKMVDASGRTPLHCLYGREPEENELAGMLIAAGADVNAKDKFGSTPLHMAAMQGALEFAKMLLDRGADPTAATFDNATGTFRPHDTPLHEIAEGSWRDTEAIKIIDLLVEHGASVNAKGNNGCTPLHRAAFLGSPAIIKELRAKGANVSARDNNGETPLDYATRFKKTENIHAIQD